MPHKTIIPLLLAACVVTAAPELRADDAPRDAARALFFEASEAMLSGDHGHAAALFDAAHATFPSPTSLLGAARALVQAGALRAALSRYEQAAAFALPADASEAFVRSVQVARKERPSLAARIPRVAILLAHDIDGVDVRIDGVALSPDEIGREIEVDPGTIVITARARGHLPFQTSVLVAERSVVPIHVTLQSASPARISVIERGPDAQSITGYALLGLGAAGVVAWGITGALVLHDKSVVEEECNASGICDSQQGVDAAERAKTMGIVNAASLIGGLAAAGVGITLVLTSDDGAASEPVGLVVGPGVMSLRGRF